MKKDVRSRFGVWGTQLVAACLMAGAASAFAAQEVSDTDLSDVAGADGVSINASLVWNSNRTQYELSSKVIIGFEKYDADGENKTLTFLTFGGFGGVMDIFGLRIDSVQGPAEIGDYVDITLPRYIGFEDFGFQSMSVQSVRRDKDFDAKQFQTSDLGRPQSSYGQWLYNGSAVMTGHVYIWPAK